MKVFAFEQKLDAQSPHGGDPKPRMSALPPKADIESRQAFYVCEPREYSEISIAH